MWQQNTSIQIYLNMSGDNLLFTNIQSYKGSSLLRCISPRQSFVNAHMKFCDDQFSENLIIHIQASYIFVGCSFSCICQNKMLILMKILFHHFPSHQAHMSNLNLLYEPSHAINGSNAICDKSSSRPASTNAQSGQELACPQMRPQHLAQLYSGQCSSR